jgi:hypothetical protein
MSKALRAIFLIHAIVAVVTGALLLFTPGRFLLTVGWAPTDRIICRLLGAALLGMAWGSLRAWRATEWAQVAILVEVGAAFTGLACVGVLRHLLTAPYPPVVWVTLGGFLVFAIAWSFLLLRSRVRPSSTDR